MAKLEKTDSAQATTDILSSEPRVREVEVALLLRLLSAIANMPVKGGQGSTGNAERAVAAALERIQHPAFLEIAEALEERFPVGPGFPRVRPSSKTPDA
jgi:hypothetical protein